MVKFSFHHQLAFLVIEEAPEWMLLIRHSVGCKVNITVLNFVAVGMALSD